MQKWQNKDSFCYNCGEFVFKENRKTIDKFYKKVYYTYFKIKLGDQDKTWATHIVCKAWKESVRLWTTGKKAALKFGIPIIWREPANHLDDCYFCMTNLVGFNKKNQKNILYSSIPSATRPIPHCDENPVPVFRELLDIPVSAASLSQDPQPQEWTEHWKRFRPWKSRCWQWYRLSWSSIEPNHFNQDDLSDLIRNLNLSKESAKLFASHLKERNFLQAKANVTFYRNRDAEFLPYFKQYEEILVCNDVELLLMELDIYHYDANSWRLFTDSSKRSLKCVLLHNTNKYTSIPRCI